MSLPSCYRAFLKELGNGGSSYANSAAGPFYGVYSFGECIEELAATVSLTMPVSIEPRMSDEGDDRGCLAACQSIKWHAKGRCRDWSSAVRRRLPRVDHAETFRFAAYLLVDAEVDCGEDLGPFCTHPNEEIRVSAFHSLGRLPFKERRIDLFLVGLRDPASRVVHATLQALRGVKNRRLVEAYRDVERRFETDEHYVLTNLKHRLKEIGLEPLRNPQE